MARERDLTASEKEKREKIINDILSDITPRWDNIEVSDNEEKLCMHRHSRYKGIVIGYKASLSTGLLEIKCEDGVYAFSGVYDIQDSKNVICDKCDNAVYVLDNIMVIFESTKIDFCNQSGELTQKFNWEDVLKWILDSPIRVLNWAPIKVPKNIND